MSSCQLRVLIFNGPLASRLRERPNNAFQLQAKFKIRSSVTDPNAAPLRRGPCTTRPSHLVNVPSAHGSASCLSIPVCRQTIYRFPTIVNYTTASHSVNEWRPQTPIGSQGRRVGTMQVLDSCAGLTPTQMVPSSPRLFRQASVPPSHASCA